MSEAKLLNYLVFHADQSDSKILYHFRIPLSVYRLMARNGKNHWNESSDMKMVHSIMHSISVAFRFDIWVRNTILELVVDISNNHTVRCIADSCFSVVIEGSGGIIVLKKLTAGVHGMSALTRRATKARWQSTWGNLKNVFLEFSLNFDAHLSIIKKCNRKIKRGKMRHTETEEPMCNEILKSC